MADKSAKKKRFGREASEQGRAKERAVGEMQESNKTRERERERVGALGESSRYRNDNRNTRATTTATTATYAQSANERAAKRTVAKKTATATAKR